MKVLSSLQTYRPTKWVNFLILKNQLLWAPEITYISENIVKVKRVGWTRNSYWTNSMHRKGTSSSNIRKNWVIFCTRTSLWRPRRSTEGLGPLLTRPISISTRDSSWILPLHKKWPLIWTKLEAIVSESRKIRKTWVWLHLGWVVSDWNRTILKSVDFS